MDRLSLLLENSKRAIRYWWLLLLVGAILIVAGISVFLYPVQSYLGLSVLEAVLASSNRHFVTGRGWMLVGGIIEIILGIILIFNVSLSAVALPIILGFWLLLRGFGTIGLGGDMTAVGVPGAGWTVFTGILLLLCSLWILLQPLVFGTTAVLVWVSISLLFAGAAAHRCMEGKC